MKFLKKHWYLIIVLIFTVGLGVAVFLTSQRLATTEEVAPTVPQEEPQAAATACTLTFALNTGAATPTPTPPPPTATPTPPAPTATPTPPPPTPTPEDEVVIVTNPTATPMPRQVALASCNNACTLNADCAGGLVCVEGSCRNPSCTTQANCSCEVAQAPQQTPRVPVSGTGPSILGASIIAGGLLILLLGLAL